MTANAGLLLVNRIMPLIAGAIAKGAVRATGCEDLEELRAEGCALVAALLESAERRGKEVPPQSVAYYAVEGLKRGRRSGYSGTADVMSPGATLFGRVNLCSIDAPVTALTEDPNQEMTLHDTLACSGETSDMAAARHLDWEMVSHRLDQRRNAVVADVATGYGTGEIAERLDVSAPRVVQIKRDIGATVYELWGPTALTDVIREPAWQQHVRAGREKLACRAGRSRRQRG
ncbi:hypothetical protein ACFLSJ_02490 [Verrucomicrobiota bacterium]